MKLNTKLSLKYWIALIGFCAIWLFIPFSDYMADNVAKAIKFDPTTLLALIVAFSLSILIVKIIIGIKNILK